MTKPSRDVYQKIAALQKSLERGWSPPVADQARILSERAERLARPEAAEAELDGRFEVIAFQVAAEPYGIELPYVREVHRPQEITSVPCTPAFVAGIINLRGQVVSVIDLNRLFGLAPAERGGGGVIVLAGGGLQLGLLADRIAGTMTVSNRELNTAMPTVVRAQYLKGVTAARLMVLDGGAVLVDKNIVVREEV